MKQDNGAAEDFEKGYQVFVRVQCAFIMAAKGATAPLWHAATGALIGGTLLERKIGSFALGAAVGGAAGTLTGMVSAANSLIEAPYQLFARSPKRSNITDRFISYCLDKKAPTWS